jgi:transposase
MPRALPLPLREQIVELHRKGFPLAHVARALNVKERTARQIWGRYREKGRVGLQTDYARCGHPGCRFPSALSEAALALKRQHPRWGAGFIRVELASQFPDVALPGTRTLQAWFHAAGLQPARAKQPPLERDRAQEVHEVWEMDQKERMRLGDGSPTSTLTVTDEASGAMLGTEVFPPVSLDAGGRGGGASGPASYL